MTTDERIAGELRSQIDHQVTAADALDTKAAALAAATFALFTFTLPHVDISTLERAVVATFTVALTLGAIGLFALTLRPRKAKFGYGADASDMLAAREAAEDGFLRSFNVGLQDARTRNETVIQEKADGITYGLWFLIATGIGLAILLGLGGIDAG
jgi:hypothetical protein